VRGHVANENRLTSRAFAKTPCHEPLSFQHMPQGDSARQLTFPETKCGIVYRANYISLSILHINQTCLSTPMLPSAPSLLFMGFPPLWIPLPNSLSPHSCVRVSLDTSVHLGSAGPFGNGISCGAQHNDPLAVLVFPGLFARLAWLGWGGRSPAFTSSSWTAHVEMVVCCPRASGTPRRSHCPPSDART
jgi:hypothetical protein